MKIVEIVLGSILFPFKTNQRRGAAIDQERAAGMGDVVADCSRPPLPNASLHPITVSCM